MVCICLQDGDGGDSDDDGMDDDDSLSDWNLSKCTITGPISTYSLYMILCLGIVIFTVYAKRPRSLGKQKWVAPVKMF